MSGPIVLLGASGYVGEAFAEALRQRGENLLALSRTQVDYSKFDVLLNFLRETRPGFLINAAGYTGRPNVDACEDDKAGTLAGNTLLPQTIAHACAVGDVPWGHVSSGCIYSGAKVMQGNGETRVESDLTKPGVRRTIDEHPEAIRGFNETDEPNFDFRHPPSSFYSGTKALGEEAAADVGRCYLWRLRIPFDRFDNSRNYLSKVQRYPKVYDNTNSISHRADFVKACLDLWAMRAPFGIYNVTNPGFVTTRQVIEKIERILKPARRFEFFSSDEEFYRVAAKTPRSNCVLDVSKLLGTGVRIRAVEEALEESLSSWTPERELRRVA
jgi:UDP-glucose 4,6-dehydratase